MWPSASRDNGTSVRPKLCSPVISSGQPTCVQSMVAKLTVSSLRNAAAVGLCRA